MHSVGYQTSVIDVEVRRRDTLAYSDAGVMKQCMPTVSCEHVHECFTLLGDEEIQISASSRGSRSLKDGAKTVCQCVTNDNEATTSKKRLSEWAEQYFTGVGECHWCTGDM